MTTRKGWLVGLAATISIVALMVLSFGLRARDVMASWGPVVATIVAPKTAEPEEVFTSTVTLENVGDVDVTETLTFVVASRWLREANFDWDKKYTEGHCSTWSYYVECQWKLAPGQTSVFTAEVRSISTVGVLMAYGEKVYEESKTVVETPAPEITAITPENAEAGDQIQIWGKYFVGGTEHGYGVPYQLRFQDQLGGINIVEGNLWSDTWLSLTLPEFSIPGHTYSVTLEREGVFSEPFMYKTGGDTPGSDFSVELWSTTETELTEPTIFISGTVNAWPFGLAVVEERCNTQIFFTRSSWKGVLPFWDSIRGMIWVCPEEGGVCHFEELEWEEDYCFSFYLSDGSQRIGDPLETKCIATPMEPDPLPFKVSLPLVLLNH